MAWIGRTGDVLYALELAGAEKDEQGRFLTSVQEPVGPGDPPAFTYSAFMGRGRRDNDILIGDSLRYRKSGHWHHVVDLLSGTGMSGVNVL